MVPHLRHSITSTPPTPSRPAVTGAAVGAELHAHKPLTKSCSSRWSRGLGPCWRPWQCRIPFRNPHIYQACAGGREWDLGVYSLFVRNVSFHKEQAGSQLMGILWPRVSPSAAPICGAVGGRGGWRGLRFANPKPWPLPRGNSPVSGVGPRCQRSFFFGYTTCGISVPQSGTEPTPCIRITESTTRPPGKR